MSEVLNKALLRAIADILQVGDVKQFASDLATDRIVPVVSVFSPIAAPMFTYEDFEGGGDLTGLATAGYTIVSCGSSEIARILALEVSVGSPTGLVGGGLISMQGFLSLGETGCKVFDYPGIGDIDAANPWESRIAKGGFFQRDGFGDINWEGLVPPGKSFSVQIDSSVNMPANTNSVVRAIYAIGPAPFQPPK